MAQGTSCHILFVILCFRLLHSKTSYWDNRRTVTFGVQTGGSTHFCMETALLINGRCFRD